MSASPLVTRRRLLLALVVLVLAAAVVAAAVALRPDADPAAAASSSASPTASSVADDDGGSRKSGSDGTTDRADGEKSGGADAGAKSGTDESTDAEPRETLDPAPFDAEVTPLPGVTVTVPSVEKVTGEANVPGEVGGPALRFTVELTNRTGKMLDLRTVVVNAYYGPDRTPATPLLKPGGQAFEPEVAADRSADGKFVFTVPPDLQDEVELEIDPGVGAAIVIFTGA